jgi:hypothetical protein
MAFSRYFRKKANAEHLCTSKTVFWAGKARVACFSCPAAKLVTILRRNTGGR